MQREFHPPDPPVSADVEELWIGLNDLKLQMNFEWSDGTPVRFTYWHPFEPNNFRDSLEDCVTIWGPVRARGRGFLLHLAEPAAASSWHLQHLRLGLNASHPGSWEGSSTASLGIWCREGMSVDPRWGWVGWKIVQAVR